MMIRPRKMDMKPPFVMTVALSVAAMLISPVLALDNVNQFSARTQFLRRGLQQDDQADQAVTQAPSVTPQPQDDQFDRSVSSQDTIPAVIVGVASSVIICAILLFVTDLRDRCKHQQLLDEREERRRAREETASSKHIERTESSEIISTHTSGTPAEKYQPQFVENKASESSVSTMTSLGCLRAAESEDLEHSLEVTELQESHRVSQGADLSYLLELKIPQGTNLAYLLELKRLKKFRECRDVAEEGMDSPSFRTIEGDCSGSQIGSVMDDDVYLVDDAESVSVSHRSRSYSRSRSQRTPLSTAFANLSSRSAPRLGISPCSSPQGSQHSAHNDNMSMASSIHSVETAPGKLTTTKEDIISPSHCKSLAKSMTSPTASLGSPSVYATSEQPTSPVQGNTNYPDSIYRTPIQSLTSAKPSPEDDYPIASSDDSSGVQSDDCLPPPTLLQRTTETLAEQEGSKQNELAQLEQLYSRDLLPVHEYTSSMHNTMLEKIEEVVGMQACIRHVDYAPGNNSSVTLGIGLMGARSHDTFPMVEDIKETSPLLDQIFVGDYILAVNNVETRGLEASDVAKLLATDEQRDDAEEEESENMRIVRLTIQSPQFDGSESDSDSDEGSSAASKASETKSEV
ncbi:unnamed protein product [Cylindrotheca closterium]|uniref:PDZ domain-containing protein n=1 Tax=Cylindrotheca closterium TaxID=2856 RepID=A0AAD2CT37_9STRA|nr:unnamed protein product [Cylindrotheca closterium]